MERIRRRFVSVVGTALLFSCLIDLIQSTPSNTGASQEQAFVRAGIKKIPVEIRLKPAPNQLHGLLYLTTRTNYTVIAEITDEQYKNVTLTYQWSVMNKTIVTDPSATQIVYSFEAPAQEQFIQVLVVHSANETGMSRQDVVVYDPIVITEFRGDSVLSQGDLLNASLQFTGTVPVKFAYKICTGADADENCVGLTSKNGTTPERVISIVHYLRFVGDYTLLYDIRNTASRAEKSYHVKIVDSIRTQRIPITPIVCSIAAVLVLTSGLIVHLKLRRSALTLESADMDLSRSAFELDDDDWADQWDQEQSFLQRVGYLVFSDGRHLDEAGRSVSSLLLVSGSRNGNRRPSRSNRLLRHRTD